MNTPSPEKLLEWKERANKKKAIVPHYFEVFPTRVLLQCGLCQHEFVRPLLSNLDEPIFVCPIESCRGRNWVPVTFMRYNSP